LPKPHIAARYHAVAVRRPTLPYRCVNLPRYALPMRHSTPPCLTDAQRRYALPKLDVATHYRAEALHCSTMLRTAVAPQHPSRQHRSLT
jgi:hypothetical protein